MQAKSGAKTIKIVLKAHAPMVSTSCLHLWWNSNESFQSISFVLFESHTKDIGKKSLLTVWSNAFKLINLEN